MSISRDNDEVRRLLGEQVPEIVSGAVEIVGIAREPGRLTWIVVHSSNADVCPVGSCVGKRGERIKSVVRALPGDRVEIIRWSESEQDFIKTLLSPAKVKQITFDAAAHRATVTVSTDSATKLTADGGLRLRLASRLAGWDLKLVET